jgi:acetate---CoA ligase (ADP-forming)
VDEPVAGRLAHRQRRIGPMSTAPAFAGKRPQLLADLLAPGTIAVVGASADPAKVGGRVMWNLRRFRPAVRVIAVSANRHDGDGEWAASLADIEVPVDQVLIAVPASAVTRVIRQADGLGARTAVVYASGFGEAGTGDGGRLKQELVAAVSGSTMRVLGPNCVGYTAVRDTGDLVMAAFYGTLDADGPQAVPITPDPIAVVSQSGGVGSMIIGHLRDVRLWPREYISTGNEYDISLTELLRAYVDDPGIRVIAIYLEGTQDPEELADALGAARRAGKVIAAMIGGRSRAGGRAVESHSGRLAQDGDLYVRYLQRCGAMVASGPWEMALIIESAARGRQLGRRAGIIAASGGMATVAADLLDELDFEFPEISAGTAEAVAGQLPAFAQAANPLDIGGATMRDPERMPAISQAMLSDPGLDMVLVTAGSMNADALQIATSVARASAGAGKPCAVFWPHVRADARDLLWRSAVPCLTNEADLRLWLTCGLRPDPGPWAPERPADPVTSPAALALRSEAAAGRPVAETTAKRIMQILGFEIPRSIVVTGEEQLPAAIKAIDFPIVMKGIAPSVIHKQELGLVAVNLRNTAAAHAAFERIRSTLRDRRLGSDVLVERYWPPRHEVIAGWTRSPLGTLLVFGTGGSAVETIADIHREFLPATDAAIDRLLSSTVAGRTITAQMPGVADRLRVQLRRIAQLAEDTTEVAFDLDINPIAVTGLGRLMVLDACFSPAAATRTLEEP